MSFVVEKVIEMKGMGIDVREKGMMEGDGWVWGVMFGDVG